MTNIEAIKELFGSAKLADVKIIITDSTIRHSEVNMIELHAHKFVLFTSCPYFKNLINFKGDKVDIINIPIFNPLVLCDIIASFYNVDQNSSNLSECEYLLEMIRCCNFLCLDNNKNLAKLYKSKIPESNFDLLLEVAYIIGYNDDIIKLIYDNSPAEYDFSDVDNALLDKLSNYDNTKIMYISGDNLIIKKYGPLSSISKSKIENIVRIPTKQNSMIVLSDDAKKIIICELCSVRVYDCKTGQFLFELSSKDKIKRVSLTHNCKKIILTNKYSVIKIWDLETGKMIKKINSNHVHLCNGMISTDETKIICNSDNDIIILDYTTGKLTKKIRTHDKIINIFVTDNKIVSVGQMVKIWNFDGMLLSLLHETIFTKFTNDISESKKYYIAPEIKSTCQSTDRKKIILVHADNSLQIWDIETGKLIIKIKGDNNEIISVQSTLDSKTIIATDKDGMIKLWDLHTGKLVDSINSNDLVHKDDPQSTDEDDEDDEDEDDEDDDIKYLQIIPFVNKLSNIIKQ